MSLEQIIRAWKDADYRASLSDDEREQLPEHPAGLVELTDADLSIAAGGGGTASHSDTVSAGPCCLLWGGINY